MRRLVTTCRVRPCRALSCVCTIFGRDTTPCGSGLASMGSTLSCRSREFFAGQNENRGRSEGERGTCVPDCASSRTGVGHFGCIVALTGQKVGKCPSSSTSWQPPCASSLGTTTNSADSSVYLEPGPEKGWNGT